MNKIQINIPEGFEIDQHKSDLSKGIIEFKPVQKKKLSYEDVAKTLFLNKSAYYISGRGIPDKYENRVHEDFYLDPNNATSKEQLECLMAYNKLRNIAEYLNKGNLSWGYGSSSLNYFICYRYESSKLEIRCDQPTRSSHVYFKTKELAEQAIEILGEEEIKKALFIY